MMPLSKAVQWIVLSTLFISGVPAAALFYHYYRNSQRAADNKYQILAIMQTSSQKEALQTRYLAEALGLSVDRPDNIYAFNAKAGEQKLLENPLIRKVRITKINPGTLYIDYDLRTPIAVLAEISNGAIDEEGIVFAIKPFLSPKKLTEFILGLSDVELTAPLWGRSIKDPKLDLAIRLQSEVHGTCCPEHSFIKRVDVSKAFVPSYGSREAVIIMERRLERNGFFHQFSRILRLNPENYQEGLANYLVLSEHLDKQEEELSVNEPQAVEHAPVIIDLRIQKLAFINRTPSAR